MKPVVFALLSLHCPRIHSQTAYPCSLPQGDCDDGFMDSTGGDAVYRSCGEGCYGGNYLVKSWSSCVCACVFDCTYTPTTAPSTPAPISYIPILIVNLLCPFVLISHSQFQLWFVVSLAADYSIGCDEGLSGYLENDDSVIIEFVNTERQDVLFTNCDSGFDTKLYLRHEHGPYGLQNNATNSCDGDDCSDDSYYCSNTAKETFTMESLSAGTYQLLLAPYASYYGDWAVEVQCGDTIGSDSYDATTSTTSFDFNFSYIWYIFAGLFVLSIFWRYHKRQQRAQQNSNSVQTAVATSITTSSATTTAPTTTPPAAAGTYTNTYTTATPQQPVTTIQYVVQPMASNTS